MANTDIPKIGFGTWKLTDGACETAVGAALEVGYRHIDTAQGYGNEAEVGSAITNSSTSRDDIFITTKVMPDNFNNLIPSLEESLSKLKTDQVDLTLIHWPSPNGDVPLEKYLGDLLKAQEAGLTRLIGVSNFTIDLLGQAEKLIGKNKLATNQVEVHPYLQNRKLVAHCQNIGLQVTAYLPLAGAKTVTDPTLLEIAKNHDAGANQVALAYLMQKGFVVIPKSGNRDRMASNFAATNLTLSNSDITAIDALDAGERIVSPEWGPDWD